MERVLSPASLSLMDASTEQRAMADRQCVAERVAGLCLPWVRSAD